jgi:hypothetical protein
MQRFPFVLTAVVGLIAIASVACGDDDDEGSPFGAAPTATSGASGSNPTPSPATGAATPAAGSPTSAAAATPAAGGGGGGSSGAAGSVTIDGTRYGVNQVRRCKPFFNRDGDLDLTGIGQGVMVFVAVNRPVANSPAVSLDVSIQGANARGVFSSIATSFDGGTTWRDDDGASLSGRPYTISGDRISGGLTLKDARNGPDTRAVAFELAIPSQINDC